MVNFLTHVSFGEHGRWSAYMFENLQAKFHILPQQIII